MDRKTETLKLQLLNDDAFAHQWLCHPGEKCKDGCDVAPIPERLKIYQSI